RPGRRRGQGIGAEDGRARAGSLPRRASAAAVAIANRKTRPKKENVRPPEGSDGRTPSTFFLAHHRWLAHRRARVRRGGSSIGNKYASLKRVSSSSCAKRVGVRKRIETRPNYHRTAIPMFALQKSSPDKRFCAKMSAAVVAFVEMSLWNAR